MSFNIGTPGFRIGPRNALDSHGTPGEDGVFFNPHVVRRLLGYLKPYRRWMALAILLMLVQTGLTLLIPYLMKVAIDQHITQWRYPRSDPDLGRPGGGLPGTVSNHRRRALYSLLGRAARADATCAVRCLTTFKAFRWCITIPTLSASPSRG